MIHLAPLLLAGLSLGFQDEASPAVHLAPASNYFQLIDLDGDRTISPPEARALLGLERRPFLRYDTDHDGRIDLEEFKAELPFFLAQLGVLSSPDAPTTLSAEAGEQASNPVTEAFARHDRDRNGSLGRLELRSLVRAHSLIGYLARIERLVDIDEDGLVSKYELRRSPVASWQAMADEAHASKTVARDLATVPAARKHPMDPLQRLDVDEDGFLTLDEMLSFAPENFTPKAAATVLARLDNNKDGRLSLIELEFALGR